MPEPAQQHGKHEVNVSPSRSRAVPTERDIDVIPEKSGQRHVPATPELSDIGGLVGRIEVQWQAHPKKPCAPDGHVRVTGEIKIELHRVGERAAPRDKETRFLPCLRCGEHRRRVLRHSIGKHHLLEQAYREEAAADAEIRELRPHRIPRQELRQHLAVVNDRPGDKLRKERNEQRIVRRLVLRRQPSASIDDVGDLLEREKRDGQREHDRGQRQSRTRHDVDVFDREPRVLEVSQHCKIRDDASRQQRIGRPFSPDRPGRRDPAAEHEVARH